MKFVPAGKKKKQPNRLWGYYFPFSPSPFFPPPPLLLPVMPAGPGWMPPLEPERGLPPRCVPPGTSISGNWQRERSAALARCSQHLDTYITGNASKEKKKISRRGGFFFFFFVLLNTFFSPLLLFLLLGLPMPQAAAVPGAVEGWGGCQVQEGGWREQPPLLKPFWGSHGAARSGDSPPTQILAHVGQSLSLPSCEWGHTARGARQGSGICVPRGTPRVAGGRVSPSRAGGERRVRDWNTAR